jgi:hypothetical protein
MSILEDVAISGIKGGIGDMGPVSSGTVFSIAVSAWALNADRVQLDDICCNNFIAGSGIDPTSTIYYHPNGFATTPTPGSGISYRSYADNPPTTTVLINEFSFPNVSGSLRPPGLQNAAAAYSSQDNSMYIFGGYDETQLSADLWKFDCGYSEWAKLSPPTSPAARHSHSMVYSSISGSLIIFGGTVASGSVGDMWSYSIADNTWSEIPRTGDGPYDRTEHTSAYDPNANQVFVWRGRSNSGTYFSELFRYNFFDRNWRRADSAAGTYCRNSLIYDVEKNELLTIAGYDSARTLASLIHSYGLYTYSWAQQTSAWPYARYSHTTVLDPFSRNLLVFGGYTDGDQAIYGMSIYNIDTGATADSPTNYPDLCRAGHCAVFNTKDSSMYVYGGRADTRSPISSQMIKYTYLRTTYAEGINVRYSERFLTKTWTHLDSIKMDSISKAESRVYNAVSFDKGSSWKIYHPVDKWVAIVQNSGGTWQYRNAGGGWTNSPVNTQDSALEKAFSISANQWARDIVSEWNEKDQSSIPLLNTNNYSLGAYVASASSQYNADCNAYRAFQGYVSLGADAAYWLNSAAPINGQWLQIDLGDKPLWPREWRIRAPYYNAGTGARCPKRFKITASNNLVQWDDIVTTFSGADMPNPTGDKFTAWYPTTATGIYRYIRLTTYSAQIDASYVGIKKLDFKSSWDINSLTRGHWESTGGFIPGTTSSVQVALGVFTKGSIPVVNSITPTYVTAALPNTELITDSWLASAINPTRAQCVIKCKLLDSITLSTDLTVYISTDNGTNYEQVTNLQTLSGADGYSYITGTKSGLVARGSNMMKTKVVVSNFKVIQIYGICVAVDYV